MSSHSKQFQQQQPRFNHKSEASIMNQSDSAQAPSRNSQHEIYKRVQPQTIHAVDDRLNFSHSNVRNERRNSGSNICGSYPIKSQMKTSPWKGLSLNDISHEPANLLNSNNQVIGCIDEVAAADAMTLNFACATQKPFRKSSRQLFFNDAKLGLQTKFEDQINERKSTEQIREENTELKEKIALLESELIQCKNSAREVEQQLKIQLKALQQFFNTETSKYLKQIQDYEVSLVTSQKANLALLQQIKAFEHRFNQGGAHHVLDQSSLTSRENVLLSQSRILPNSKVTTGLSEENFISNLQLPPQNQRSMKCESEKNLVNGQQQQQQQFESVISVCTVSGCFSTLQTQQSELESLNYSQESNLQESPSSSALVEVNTCVIATAAAEEKLLIEQISASKKPYPIAILNNASDSVNNEEEDHTTDMSENNESTRTSTMTTTTASTTPGKASSTFVITGDFATQIASLRNVLHEQKKQRLQLEQDVNSILNAHRSNQQPIQ